MASSGDWRLTGHENRTANSDLVGYGEPLVGKSIWRLSTFGSGRPGRVFVHQLRDGPILRGSNGAAAGQGVSSCCWHDSESRMESKAVPCPGVLKRPIPRAQKGGAFDRYTADVLGSPSLNRLAQVDGDDLPPLPHGHYPASSLLQVSFINWSRGMTSSFGDRRTKDPHKGKLPLS